MKTRTLLLLSLTLILLAACSPSESRPEPTSITLGESSSIPLSPTSPPSTSADRKCPLNRSYLDALAAGLPIGQAVLSHQSYGGEDTLAVWLVSPEIDPTAVEQGQAIAEQQAIQVSKTLVESDPCLLEIETLLVTVVDAEYRQWFSGSLRTIDLPNLQTEQSGGGTESEQGGGRESLSQNTLPADACTFPEVAAQLKSEFSSRQLAASFTFVRDAGGNIVYAQWSVPDREAALNVLDSVLVIAGQTPCLYPPATGISVLLTLPDGQTLLSGLLPIAPSQDIDPSTFTFNFIPQP